jgi:hypothetical protein
MQEEEAEGQAEVQEEKEKGEVMRSRTILTTAVCLALALPASASAATVIGSTGVPNDFMDNTLRVQDVDPGEGGDLYRVPFAGVMTSWGSQANAVANRTQKLIIVRNDNLDNDWDIAAKDELRTLATPNALNTFAVRIPVASGDLLALWTPDGQPGGFTSATWNNPGPNTIGTAGAPEPVATFNTASFNLNSRLNVTATIESDADGDGFGDETQDKCPSVATTQAACPVKKCKKKKKKGKGKDAGTAAKKKGCKKRKKRKST